MSACFMDCSLRIGLLLVVEQVAKLACDLTRPAPMSGGSSSRTAPREGYLPVCTSAVLRARKIGETLGDAGGVTDPRRASLTTLGAASPLFLREDSATERSDGVALGMCRVQSSHAGTPAGPSVSGAPE